MFLSMLLWPRGSITKLAASFINNATDEQSGKNGTHAVTERSPSPVFFQNDSGFPMLEDLDLFVRAGQSTGKKLWRFNREND